MLDFLRFGRKKQFNDSFLEDFIKYRNLKLSYLCTVEMNQMKSMADNKDKQQAARRLISERLRYLSDHEKMIQRMVDRKWQEMLPQIEHTIERKIDEHINN